MVPISKRRVQLKIHLSKQLSSKARTDICSTISHTVSARNAVTNAPFTHYIYVDEVYATSEMVAVINKIKTRQAQKACIYQSHTSDYHGCKHHFCN